MSAHLRKEWRKLAAGGWVVCADGVERWGPYGAAGVLLTSEGKYLLGLRSSWVDQPNTWGIPGGALHQGETPVEGAFREAQEEIGGWDGAGSVVKVYTNQVASDWAYTTVVIAVEMFEPHADDSEMVEVGWFTRDEMSKLRLHPPFASSLGQVLG